MTSLRDEMKVVIAYHKQYAATLKHNAELIDIHEGDLLKYVLKDLAEQLSEKSYSVAKHRVPPINLLNKIIEKTCTIYTPGPVRRVVNGNETTDVKAFEWYLEKQKPTPVMAQAAELYTLCKACLVQLYAYNLTPGMRVVTNDRFFVFSTDKVDDMKPTHVVTLETKMVNGAPKTVYTAYTSDEFLIFDEDENVDIGAMNDLNNPEGRNPYGVLPFIYRSASKYSLFPKPDQDVMRMTRLIPVMMSDLNYAVMFQCFSLMYAKNTQQIDAKMAPNALWYITKDPAAEGDAEIGVIKPTVDYDGVMGLIQSELSLWLNSRGIRPGAIGKLDGDSFANGISKIIDEMDTIELRQKLVEVFSDMERELWDTELHTLHPQWVKTKQISMTQIFTDSMQIETAFAVQQPLVSRGQIVKDAKDEVEADFISRRRAIKRLNPTYSDKEIDELIAEIDGLAEGVSATQDVQQGSLNGAQVDSLAQILERVAAGTLPKDSAKVLIRNAFAMPDDQVNAMLDPIVPASVNIEETSI